MTRLSALKLSLILASSWSACALAQEAPQEPQVDEGSAIIVTGTRAVGMQATDSAAPIQVLGQDAIARVGQPNLNQVLTQIVPSFTAQTQGTDLSSFSLSARLRASARTTRWFWSTASAVTVTPFCRFSAPSPVRPHLASTSFRQMPYRRSKSSRKARPPSMVRTRLRASSTSSSRTKPKAALSRSPVVNIMTARASCSRSRAIMASNWAKMAFST